MTEFFLSHSNKQKDQEYSACVAANLTAFGSDVWFDRKSLRAGDYWQTEILNEAARRENFILMLSRDSWQSVWVQEEVFTALSYAVEKKKNIYVLHLDDVNIKHNALGRELQKIQHLDARRLGCIDAAKQLDALANLHRWPNLTYQELAEAYSRDVENSPPIATSLKTINAHESSLPEPPRKLLRAVKEALLRINLLFRWAL